MAIPAKEVREKLKMSQERRAKISKRAKELIEQEVTLRDLRRARELTQEHLAEILGIEQDGVSRMERRADMLVSTMDSYIQAMGGRLRLVVEFPDREPLTIKLSDLSETESSNRRKQTKRVAKTATS